MNFYYIFNFGNFSNDAEEADSTIPNNYSYITVKEYKLVTTKGKLSCIEQGKEKAKTGQFWAYCSCKFLYRVISS